MSLDFIFKDFSAVIVEVLTALSPILVLFLVFMVVYKLPKEMLIRLLVGVMFAFAGLTLFLQGVKAGFMPVGTEMGALLGNLPHKWILIPLGFILGFVATMAEPAVRILSNQVEENSSGYIKSNIILYTLCLSVGIFIALGMTRIVYGIPFYYIIIPGYLLAIVLMFFSQPSFTAVAFDSGGVATGPMTVTFIMALAVGAADVIEGRDAVIDGFGLIALVALAPIIMVMLLGFMYPTDESDEEDQDQELNNGAKQDQPEPNFRKLELPEDQVEQDTTKKQPVDGDSQPAHQAEEIDNNRNREKENDPGTIESKHSSADKETYDEEGTGHDPDTKT